MKLAKSAEKINKEVWEKQGVLPVDWITFEKVTFNFLQNKKDLRVLDVGCYDCRWRVLFEGQDYYGVDISDKIKKAKSQGLKVKQADLTRGFPYQNNYFDMLFINEVIEHIVDVDFFLKECCRVLKKNGRIIIITPNVASFNTRLRLLLLGETPTYIRATENHGHYHIFSVNDLRILLQKHRFKNIHAMGKYLFVLPGVNEHFPVLNKLFSKIATKAPTISNNIIVSAKKQ